MPSNARWPAWRSALASASWPTLADVSTDTIARLERGEDYSAGGSPPIRVALKSAGVIFVEENGGGPGVRLRKVSAT